MEHTQPHLKVGQYIKLGTCSQRKTPSEYKLYDWHETSIEWRVIAIEGNRALLLSRYCLVNDGYSQSDTTWETSSLRSSLNDLFDSYFSEAEQMMIQEYETAPGIMDKVFILSPEEVEKYLPFPETRLSSPTPYVIDCYDYSYSYLAGHIDFSSEEPCSWFLRFKNHTMENDYVAPIINTKGEFSRAFRNSDDVFLRPAIWIRFAPNGTDGSQMHRITDEDMSEIIWEQHIHWQEEDCDGWENMRADFSGCILPADSYYDYCSSMNFCCTDWHDISYDYTNVSESNLFYANMQNVRFPNGKFYKANLSGVNLRSADLSKADFTWANLSGADLRNANLSDADLRYANLFGADLRGANLSGANLSRSCLLGANFAGANLSATNMQDTTYD